MSVGATPSLVESLLEQDRPAAWWGLDAADPLADDSGRGYTLTAQSAPASVPTLYPRGDLGEAGARDFDGIDDAYWVLGTQTDSALAPPTLHDTRTTTATATATIDVWMPPAVQAGALCVCVLAHSSATATISTAPAGWTQVGTTVNAGTHALAVFRRQPSVAEPVGIYRWVWSGAGTLCALVVTYHDPDPALTGGIAGSSVSATASGTSHATGSVAHPEQALALTVFTANFAGQLTNAGAHARPLAVASSGNLVISACDYALPSAGSVQRHAQTSVATTCGTVMITTAAAPRVVEDALDAITERVSIMAMVRPDTVSGTRTIVRKRGAWGLRISAGALQFVFTDSAGAEHTVTGPALAAGVTRHVCVCDEGTQVAFYLDGTRTAVARPGAAGYQRTTHRLVIGAHHTGSAFADFFDGVIDEVAIFAGALTPHQVRTHVQAAYTGFFGHHLLVDRSRYPRLMLEWAPTSNPTDPTLAFEDISRDLRAQGLSLRMGRNYELDHFEPGRLDFTLDNRDGRYDPAISSPVEPVTAVRLRAQVRRDERVYPLFLGYTEGHPITRLGHGHDSIAQVTCSDVLRAFSAERIATDLVRSRERSGERIRALLGAIPGVRYRGDTGSRDVAPDNLVGLNRLGHARQVAETEGGILYADGSGTIRFRDRAHRPREERQVRVTFGAPARAGEIPLRRHEPAFDNERHFTAAAVTPPSGIVYTASDEGAAKRYFARTRETTTLHADDRDALAMAQAFARRYARPRMRVRELEALPARAPDALAAWDALLRLEVSSRVRTVERPPLTPQVVTRDHYIEGIRHDISSAMWVYGLSLSPAELDGDVWTLGVGKLGQASGLETTRLGD